MIGFKRFLHYGFWTLTAVFGIATSEALLQSGHTVYLHFDRAVFAEQWFVLLGCVLVAGLTGTMLDRPSRPAWQRRLPRIALGFLLNLALFQIARRSPYATWTSQHWVKLAALGACILLAVATAVWFSDLRWRRLVEATGIVCLCVFGLQPGMAQWLISPGSTSRQAQPDSHGKAAERRVVVLLLDEWDEEMSEGVGFFERPELQGVLRASYRNTALRPGGPSTLTSVPSMLRGARLGKVDSGGVGYLVSKEGDRFDAGQALLFKDLEQAQLAYGVIGFYHDYCRLAPGAKPCEVQPMHFFPGWGAALLRPLWPGQDLQDPASSFLNNWRQTYRTLHREAMAAVADTRLQFTWIHLNLPHPPSLAEGPSAGLREDYLHNLELAASVIKEVTDTLSTQHQPSAVVMLSDHWLREKEFWGPLYARQLGKELATAGKSSDQRVPLVVWFSDGQGRGSLDHEPKDAIRLRQLVQGLLTGRVSSPAQVPTALSDPVVH